MTDTAQPGTAPDIETFLDNVPFSRFHVKVMALGALAMLVDGFDLGVLSWVLPMVSDDFGVKRVDLTWVISMQMIGMALGAYFIAPLADQVGRKKLVMIAMLGVSVCCFVTILTQTVLQLAIARLVTGMFASAVIANMVALSSELAPARQRSTVVTVVLAGAMPGAILGSLMQAFLLEPFGWHVAFWLGGVMPLLLLPPLLMFLPESPKFLATRNPADPRLRAIVASLSPGGSPAAFTVPDKAEGSVSSLQRVRELFAPGLALPTTLLWLGFLGSFGFISAATWKTTVFRDLVGLGWQNVGITTGIGVVAGAIGMVTIGVTIDRYGFKAIVPTYFLIAAAAAIGMALLAPGWGMYVALAINALTQHAAHAGLASIASSLYPTRNRATGVGLAYGAGRAVSVIGPFYGALALEHGWGALGYFFLLAGPLACAGVMLLILLTVRPIQAAGRVAAH
ncbi:MFS transporter [Novosphingobium aquimarinum]|uniref:MFS transporter n=1 Tax=Novosphingobium aquimarinum TaxID=2682494 RepID=UPI0012EC6B7F|nr:MFS transporter [Novosphingobium aquimarinum]